MLKAMGYSWEHVVGSDARVLRSDPEVADEIRKTLAAGQAWEGLNRFVDKAGEVRQARVNIAPIKDASGAVAYFVGVAHDITEEQKLERARRQSQKMEAIGTLAGGIAHDFNNILAAIIGFTELTIDELSDNPKGKERMERVLQAGLRGRDLVKQILAFSRKSEAKREKISLTPVVKETHSLLRASLPSTIQMDLIITAANDYIVADPAQVQQILMNLGTNAADAMREEGGQLTIGIAQVTFGPDDSPPDPDLGPGDYVTLTVRDTGAGMAEEVRRRLFEPFFTTKGPGKGTGMGLAVVYGLVKEHDGAVTVKSEAGQGSIFEVFFPQASRPHQKKEEPTIVPLPTGTERILFVDDEEMLVTMARGMLESLGYTVTVAHHGAEAWNLFLEDPSRFDLVITDQTMPDLAGVSLAKNMLKVRKELPIILCTGYSENVSAEHAEHLGISGFMMKPMVKKELAYTIRQVLEKKSR
jgi:PAS domain S-box-containing protein